VLFLGRSETLVVEEGRGIELKREKVIGMNQGEICWRMKLRPTGEVCRSETTRTCLKR
jgi:hypothetical protein